jgi:hypothetical protein
MMLLLALILVFGLVMPAWAHFRAHEDPNDSRSRLDIDAVAMDHNINKLRFIILTHGGWNKRALADGDNGFYVWLDTRGSGRDDFVIFVFTQSGDLRGRVFTWPEGERIGSAFNIRHPRRRILVFDVNRSLVRARADLMRWMVSSSYYDRIDFAPNGGSFVHHFN